MNAANRNPYCRFCEDDMILRDFLALDRTILANERTLLSYTRTAMAFVITGVTFIKFFGSPTMTVVGWLCIPVGVAILAWGVIRYRKIHERIHAINTVPSGERPIYKTGGPV